MWASALGRDAFGLYAEFTIPGTNVGQRMRWIPPGRFEMGSPESEKGRWDWERPRHPVELASGFWLFDTPCTQDLWQAVMGSNPSRFIGPRRPVEQVSFEDARAFIQNLNARIEGLNLSLPSEAQWEYACRAGRQTATYAGDLDSGNAADAARLDEIAWYEGNSGGETHDVGGKRPNAWGLHDMLGNVLEWCADNWHSSYDGAPSNGAAWLDPEAGGAGGRVFRGGSWVLVARDLRAASRLHSPPDVRVDGLGFRCARVEASGGESEAAAGGMRRRRSERSEPAATKDPRRREAGSRASAASTPRRRPKR